MFRSMHVGVVQNYLASIMAMIFLSPL